MFESQTSSKATAGVSTEIDNPDIGWINYGDTSILVTRTAGGKLLINLEGNTGPETVQIVANGSTELWEGTI